jgi:hypothetical protein
MTKAPLFPAGAPLFAPYGVGSNVYHALSPYLRLEKFSKETGETKLENAMGSSASFELWPFEGHEKSVLLF